MTQRLARPVRRDLAAVALTRSSDRWRVWLVVAAMLAAFGGRFGRRAALRGVGSAAIASVAAEGVLKPIVRRRRPPRPKLDRLVRLAGSHPGSSFPSGHTAVGVAFAAGAAQELPWTAPALGALAAAVGWGRIQAGEHFPSDVAAGVAIGAGAALVTRRVWPVAPHTAAAARPALHRRDARPRPDGAGVEIVVNPSAGPALGRDPATQLRDALPAAKIVALADGDDLRAALERAATTAEVIGVCGGDGSVNTAAGVALAHDRPLFVIPGGTLNHFARDIGVTSVADAIDALRDGGLAEVDLGTIGNRPFLNTASFGAYPELVDARERLERRIGKWTALVVALVRVLWRATPCRVEIDGEERRVWMSFVGNCKYHPSGFAPSWRERLDDGLFDIRLVDGRHPFSRTRLVLAVLSGRLGRCRVYDQRAVRSMRIRSLDGPLRLASDGETFDGPDVVDIAKADRPLVVVTAEPLTDAQS